MRPVALVLFMIAVAPAHGQLFDSIAYFSAQEPRFVAKLDMRGSFISNHNVRIGGVKVGLEHAHRFQYGIGYSFLLSPVRRWVPLDDGREVELRLRLGYIAPYVDYAFYQRGPWEVRIPVQIGIGGGSQVYRDADGRRQVYRRTPLVIYEPAMTVQYRFMRYLGVGAGWGFRLAWHTRGSLDEGLTAPIYTLGLRVFFGELWKEMRADRTPDQDAEILRVSSASRSPLPTSMKARVSSMMQAPGSRARCQRSVVTYG